MEGKILQLPRMELSDVTKESDTLRQQADKLSAEVVNLEGQLTRERMTSSMLQVICLCDSAYMPIP